MFTRLRTFREGDLPENCHIIADLEAAPDITATYLAEAIQHRRLDRNLFA